MKVEFTVKAPPMGKQRPRMCRIKGKNIAYTPRQTIEYERLIRASYTAVSKVKFPQGIPLEISITALFLIPKSAGKSLRELMSQGKILPTKRPDSDNIIKIGLDALNGICYHDDSQICKIYFEKKYDEIPQIKIKISDIGGNLGGQKY